MELIIMRIFHFLKYGYRGDSDIYINYLKRKGVKIGRDVSFYAPYTNIIDITRPFAITIGNGVDITAGVTILTHDYSWGCLKRVDGYVLGAYGKVEIGNNVFIGINSMILKNVKIGDNVIIGANSLVNKDLDSNSVYAGNPIRKICSIDEYKEKIKKRQIAEATELYIDYKKRYDKTPEKKLFREFFWLFDGEYENGRFAEKEFDEIMRLSNNYEKSLNAYITLKKVFSSYEEFIDYCEEQYINRQNQH